MNPEHELFFKVAKHLGINVTDISLLSQVEVNRAYLRIIEKQIEAQSDIVNRYEPFITEFSNQTSGIKLEYYTELRKLLDLEVEYAAKQSYIIHHEKFTSKQP